MTKSRRLYNQVERRHERVKAQNIPRMYCGRVQLEGISVPAIELETGSSMEDFDRRSFMKIGSLAAFRWITMGDVLEQRAMAEAKRGDDISVIHLFLTGGMSQMDTFDPKPNAKPELRSKFKADSDSVYPAYTSRSICPDAPSWRTSTRSSASMTHKTPVHVPACGLILSGQLPLSSITSSVPGLGGGKELGPRNELPAFCSVPGSTGYWESAGYLEPRFNPFDAGIRIRRKFQVRDLDLPLGVDWARMDHRRSLLKVADDKFRKYDSRT